MDRTEMNDVDPLVARVAQLWCLPKHEKKVMDTDFAYSIVDLLKIILAEQRETSARVVEAYNPPQKTEHIRFCVKYCAVEIARLIRDQK